MTHASLFSGIGGPEIAAQMMGWTNAFHCEINPFGRRILDYWFPKSVSYEDITRTDFMEWRGRINVLTGGFPYQPFSCAGKRRGAEDDRYLWPEMLRAIREIQPSWVVGENVAGILTMVQPGGEVEMECEGTLFGEGDVKRPRVGQRYVTETVCTDLEREGYSVQPFVVPACAVGAPHRRDRVFFVAHADRDRRRGREDEQKPVTGSGGASHSRLVGEDGSSSCPNGAGLQEEGTRQRPAGIAGVGLQGFSAHSDRYGLEGGMRETGSRSPEVEPETPYPCGMRYWQDFPTQSPVCRGDDGISGKLDGITFSKWRKESLKAYGNAILPQVMYEIFRAIEETENDPPCHV